MHDQTYYFSGDTKHKSTFSIKKGVHISDFIWIACNNYCKGVQFGYTAHKMYATASVNIMAFVDYV